MARLCERAGVAPGSIYEYFPSKDAVVHAILEGFADDAQRRLLAGARAAADRPAAEVLDESWRTLIDYHRSMLRLHPEFYRSYLRHFLPLRRFDPAAPADAASRHAQEVMRAILGEDPPLAVDLPLEQAAFLLSRGVASLLEVTILERPEFLFDDRYLEVLRAMAQRTILREKARPGARGRRGPRPREEAPPRSRAGPPAAGRSRKRRPPDHQP